MTLGPVVTRRTALKTLATSAGSIAFLPWLSERGVATFTNLRAAKAKPALRVLTAEQYATTEALVEAIIPADDRSGGAKEARVADFIDLLLSEAPEAPKQEWLEGLAALDAESAVRFKACFVKLLPQQVEALLTDISRFELNEPDPGGPEPPKVKPVPDIFGGVTRPDPKGPSTLLEKFFAVTKQATVDGYYTSEIGIHKELRYKGNQILAEFVGCLTQDGKDCPHCGRKAGE